MTTRDSSLTSGLTRRQMISTLALASGAVLAGFDRAWPATPADAAYGFPNGRLIGTVPFSKEGNPVMNTVIDGELDGRLMTDLAALPWNTTTVPTGHFYIRTRASTLISSPSTWSVSLGDPENAQTLDLDQLRRDAKPRGIQVLECSGNGRGRHFGLMSAADWQGVPLLDVVSRQLPPPSESARVVVSGFDIYKAVSKQSVPGASWNFSRAQLQDTGAFLATSMNGGDLPLDHGAPVRLVV
ncbi:MAG TPA: molybdopterin-dependent oxidoreductase, partial [Vicinamibacterales bacterium]